MIAFKRLLIYVVLVTSILARMDWKPIHYAWWHYGQYPDYARTWLQWTDIRVWAARVLCPPCGALAENYYYALMDVEAGEAEQAGVMPTGWTHNPINPHGDWSFRWGQGAGQPWRRVSMLSFYLYWLPYTVAWWLVVGDLFRGKRPWWLEVVMAHSRKRYEEKKTQEAERALQHIIGGINLGKIIVKRFNLWPSGSTMNVSMQFDYDEDEEDDGRQERRERSEDEVGR